MKPNDKAIEAALLAAKTVLRNNEITIDSAIFAAVTAAYAAQLPPSEDYAELVKWLRDKAESLSEIYPPEAEAADALEAVLAERDALKDILPNQNHEGRAPIPTDWWGVAFLERRKRRAAEKERDALLARLAPVDDEELVEIAAHCEAIFDGWTFSSLERLSQDVYRVRAHQLLAAIRPHIEAAERERCAKIVEKYENEKANYLLDPSARSVATLWRGEIAAAIRSGK